jgi:hypothetical protein
MFALQFAGRDAPSTVISFAQKSLKDGQVVSKLHVIELGSVPGEQPCSEGQTGHRGITCRRVTLGWTGQMLLGWPQQLRTAGRTVSITSASGL